VDGPLAVAADRFGRSIDDLAEEPLRFRRVPPVEQFQERDARHEDRQRYRHQVERHRGADRSEESQ
jgi:hypothetical protein